MMRRPRWRCADPTPPESTGWVCAICHTPGRLGQPCEQCGAQVYRSAVW